MMCCEGGIFDAKMESSMSDFSVERSLPAKLAATQTARTATQTSRTAAQTARATTQTALAEINKY